MESTATALQHDNIADNQLNSADQEDDVYFKSDEFRMSSMKVLPCSKRFVHDWTECPFAHPQEKARRRDPRVHSYTGIACPSMKKEGNCAFGDHCPYAHNVFEYWLHPTRYRTQLCNDGSNCRRKICFFAHSLDELRVPACKPFVSPEALAEAAASAASDADLKRGAPIPSPLSSPSLPPISQMVRSSFGDLETPKAAAAAASFDNIPAGGADFNQQEQQVIELVTTMLAQNKITPSQAASILQQMLPSTSLQVLQDRLGLPTTASPPSSNNTGNVSAGMYSAFEQVATMPEQEYRHHDNVLETTGVDRSAFFQSGDGVVSGGGGGSLRNSLDSLQAAHARAELGLDASRKSFESERSSFDTARMSLELGGRTSLDLSTPRASLEYMLQPGQGRPYGAPPPPAAAYNPPAAAYPQYWAQNHLTTVHEGFPMINTPARRSGAFAPSRRSTGSSMESAADRLSAEYGRMSLESNQGNDGGFAAAVGPWQHPAAPQVTNPYASAFFAETVEPTRYSAPPAGHTYYAGQFGEYGRQ